MATAQQNKEHQPETRRVGIFPSYRPVQFRHHCPARQLYLLLGGEDGAGKILSQMGATGEGRWGLTLRLKPGAYRYRFYADHGQVTTYVSPGEADDPPVKMNGFDALLTVPPGRAPVEVSTAGVNGGTAFSSHDRNLTGGVP